MTTRITDVQDGRPAPASGAAPELSALAEHWSLAARNKGVDWTGPGGLLTGLTRQVLETALDVDLGERHDRGQRYGPGKGRDGSSGKIVRTDAGRNLGRRAAHRSPRVASQMGATLS